MRLVTILKSGATEEYIELSKLATEMIQANTGNYERNGFKRPWCAYLAVKDKQIVGTCAFKAPLKDGKVEIAYFTFPGFEGQGIATEMTRQLLEIAQSFGEPVKVVAQTLAEKNASTSILVKFGFHHTRSFMDPQDGELWEWEVTACN